jgi:hypothetical protein
VAELQRLHEAARLRLERAREAGRRGGKAKAVEHPAKERHAAWVALATQCWHPSTLAAARHVVDMLRAEMPAGDAPSIARVRAVLAAHQSWRRPRNNHARPNFVAYLAPLKKQLIE